MDSESLGGKRLGDFDVIVTMESRHRDYVLSLCPECGDRVVVSLMLDRVIRNKLDLVRIVYADGRRKVRCFCGKSLDKSIVPHMRKEPQIKLSTIFEPIASPFHVYGRGLVTTEHVRESKNLGGVYLYWLIFTPKIRLNNKALEAKVQSLIYKGGV